MNVITFFPNYYAHQTIHPSIAYSQPNVKVPPIISLISQALKTSIITYEKELFLQNQRKNSEKKEEQTIMAIKVFEQEAIKPSQEIRQKSIKIFKSQRENNELKEVIIEGKSQKTVKESSQTITNDSGLSEGIEIKQAEKTRILSRTNKKEKSKLKNRLAQMKISSIDLLQFAQMPALGIAAAELSKKREALLERKVVAWDQKFKDRRGKREIRMLNF